MIINYQPPYKYSLEERRYIYSRPLRDQFVPVFTKGAAVVLKHLIKYTAAEDYERVFDVAQTLAIKKQGAVFLLPEINAQEKNLRRILGLSTEHGRTPDIMLTKGRFIDVKSPRSIDKISANACKAYKQGGVVCITNHFTPLKESLIERYSRWVFNSQGYDFNEAFFFIDGKLYKKTRG